jgi:hypothetical protein
MKGGGAKGSFGIPEEMQEAIKKSKKQAEGAEASKQPKEEYRDSESIPEDIEKKVEKEEAKELTPEEVEVREKEKRDETAEKLKKELGIEFDDDDMWNFYFNNTLTKRNVVIVPDKVQATFRTIDMDENELINDALSRAVDEKILEIGIQNVRVKYTLACALVEYGKPGKMKSLGETLEDRLKAIGKMNTMMVDMLIKKWNKFTWLLEYTHGQDQQVKN